LAQASLRFAGKRTGAAAFAAAPGNRSEALSVRGPLPRLLLQVLGEQVEKLVRRQKDLLRRAAALAKLPVERTSENLDPLGVQGSRFHGPTPFAARTSCLRAASAPPRARSAARPPGKQGTFHSSFARAPRRNYRFRRGSPGAERAGCVKTFAPRGHPSPGARKLFRTPRARGKDVLDPGDPGTYTRPRVLRGSAAERRVRQGKVGER